MTQNARKIRIPLYPNVRRRYYYEHNHSGTRKRTHPFYRHAARSLRSSSAVSPRSCPLRCKKSHCNGSFYDQHGFIVCRQHDIPFCQLLRAHSAYLSENGSYDDFHPDRRDLYAGMPVDPAKALRSDATCRSLGNRAGRNFYQRLLDHLSKMVFLCFVYRNGLELPVRSGTAVFPASASRLFMAARRRTDLYCRRHYLRAQAAAV